MTKPSDSQLFVADECKIPQYLRQNRVTLNYLWRTNVRFHIPRLRTDGYQYFNAYQHSHVHLKTAQTHRVLPNWPFRAPVSFCVIFGNDNLNMGDRAVQIPICKLVSM